MTSVPDSAASNPPPADASTICLRVSRIDDLYQPFDPAPMERRGLAAEVDAYVLDQIESHPPTAEVSLRIFLPASESACCDAVQQAFRDHFARAALRKQDALRKHFQIGRRTLIGAVAVALVFSVLSQTVAALSDVSIVQRLANGISIVVWVTLWRPIEFLLHDWRGVDQEMKTYLRLSKADVRCVAES